MKLKSTKRREAEARSKKRAARSPKEQLAKLDAGKHAAKKERTRLLKLLKQQ
jgi:hypothetical protein